LHIKNERLSIAKGVLKMNKSIPIILSIVFLSLTALVFAGELENYFKNKGLHVADLSEEDKINLQINKLEQAINQQWIEKIQKLISEDYTEADPSFTKETIKGELESIFSDLSETRDFLTQTNPQTGWKATSTQDFYIRNSTIEVDQDKATVEARIGFFWAGEDYKGVEETLTFTQEEGTWRLSESKNLFGFLERASKSTRQEVGTVYSPDDVMLQSEADFTSTHLLAPVTLCYYGKTAIPRFNKTESLNWFDVNCMNSPYGIIADVQVTPPNPEEFTHEFLFVTDVTSQKVLVSDKDEWVGEFGTEGSGQGQFWGPHGISNRNCCHYFVADMFNNRIVSYYYDKGDEQPTWSFNLTAGFNWPIDVEVREANDSLSPPEPDYVVVADHRNHRLALFRWGPGYDPSFDQYYGEYGSGEGQFIYPTAVCFGRDPESGWQTNDIFVTDYGNDRLVWLYIGPEGIVWRGTYQFPTNAELTSVEVDNKGLVYVVDRHNAKIHKFATCPSSSFELLGIWGERGAADGQLYWPNVLTVAHGRYCDYPEPCVPFTWIGDVFISESWGDQTGVRRFVIGADVVNLSANYVPYNEDTGEGNFIWYTYHLTDFAEDVTEQVYLGAEVCTTYDRGSLNYGSQGGEWNVGSHPHGETYTVKITASSIYDPTVVVEKSVDVYVDTITTHNPIISRGIRCNLLNDPNNWCDGCGQCIKTGHSYIVDVQAFDPDGDPILYEWSCGYGWLVYEDYFYKRIEIPESYICYQAPVSGKTAGESEEGFESPMSASSKHSSAGHTDFIGVTVRDPYGGEAHTSELFTVYEDALDCLCGDVTANGIVDSADITRLIGYLCLGESPPPDPIERADANDDCQVDTGDIAALINYIFLGADPPGCCWIH
jgi:hypothetical protein